MKGMLVDSVVLINRKIRGSKEDNIQFVFRSNNIHTIQVLSPVGADDGRLLSHNHKCLNGCLVFVVVVVAIHNIRMMQVSSSISTIVFFSKSPSSIVYGQSVVE